MIAPRNKTNDPFSDEFFTNHGEWKRKMDRRVRIGVALYAVAVFLAASIIFTALQKCAPTVSRVGSKFERILDKAAR